MKDKISLSSRKSRIALILVLILLLQICMPIMKVEAATTYRVAHTNSGFRYNLGSGQILRKNDTITFSIQNNDTIYFTRSANGESTTYTYNNNANYTVIDEYTMSSDVSILAKSASGYSGYKFYLGLYKLNEISFDTNGGEDTIESRLISYNKYNNSNYSELRLNNISNYNDATKVGLPTPTREGYIFDGWYTEAEGGTQVTNDTKFNSANDVTLYAHWIQVASYSVNDDLTYTGEEQTGITYDSDTTNITGTYKATNAGDYTATLTPKDGYVWSDDRTTGAREVNWSISKQSLTIPTLSNTAKSFTDSEQSPTITGYDENTMTQTGTASAKDVGNYTINWNLKDSDNYKWNDDTITEKSANWSISSVNISDDILKFEDNEVDYDGEEHSINITGGLPGGTIEYSTDGVNYSETLPTYTDAGEYTIYYKASKLNYNEKTGSKTLKINKLPITVKANDKTIDYGDETPTFDYTITSGSLVTGETLKNINYSGTNQTNAGTYTIEISQTSDANKNYDITFENGTYTINKKAITPEITLSQNEFIYNKSEQKPTVFVKLNGTDIATSEYTTEFTTDSTNVENKSVKVTCKNINYTFDEVELPYVINAKTIDSSMVTIEDSQYVFDYTDKTPVVTLKDGDYTLVKDTDYEVLDTSITTAKNYGNYSIIVKGKGNYKDEYTIPWTITKAHIDGVTINGVNTIYDGTDKEIDVTIPAGATIKYKTNAQDEYSNTKPTFKDAGNYTVYYKVEIDNNYNVIENSVPVIITPKDVTVTADDKIKIYGEDDEELTYTAEGLIGNETLKGITLSREVGEDVGEYTITTTKDTTKDTNYNITIQNGTYTINKKTITEEEIKEIVSIENQVYTGEKVEPEIVIKDGDKIVPNTEYTVKYSNNVKPGTAKVTITNVEGGNYIIETTELTFVIIDPGKVEFVETETSNANNAKVNESPEEVIAKIELTEEDIDNIKHGKNIDLYLEVKDISDSVSNSDKKAIEEKLGKDTLGMYLDVSLFKKITGEDATKITETKEPITISFEIPDELINNNSKVERSYKVLRLHDGVVEELDVKVDGKTATFETDKFSTYALAFTDTEMSSSPKTGDNITMYVIMFIISLLGIRTLSVSNKRKSKKARR